MNRIINGVTHIHTATKHTNIFNNLNKNYNIVDYICKNNTKIQNNNPYFYITNFHPDLDIVKIIMTYPECNVTYILSTAAQQNKFDLVEYILSTDPEFINSIDQNLIHDSQMIKLLSKYRSNTFMFYLNRKYSYFAIALVIISSIIMIHKN